MAKAAKADVGHNSELTAEERKALFMDHFKPIAAQYEVVKAAQAEYKRLRKLAKAEKIAGWEIDHALRCAEIEDGNIMVDRMKREAEIAAWFALPVDYQPDMFGDFSREHGEDLARKLGRKAGATGEGSNPYDEHTANGKAWAEGWEEEQKAARIALQSAMEKRNRAKDELIKKDDPFEVDQAA